MKAVELAIAAVLAAMGIRSLVVWLGRDFQLSSPAEHVAYALHVTARAGLWLAFAGLFAGYALVDRPEDLRWYILVPISLAAVQLLTGLYLARSGST